MFPYEFWGMRSSSAVEQMAIEEMLLKRSAAYGTASIRTWDFQHPAVVVGYGQAADPVKVNDGSFSVVRRPSGGSHVYFGSNCLAYTFVVPRNGQFTHYNDMRAYYSEHVVNTLGNLGVDDVSYDPVASAILVNGIPVAGEAVVCGPKSILMHGLLVLSPYDSGMLNRTIRLGERKIGGRVYRELSAIENIPAVSALFEGIAPEVPPALRITAAKKLFTQALLYEVTSGRHTNFSVPTHAAMEVDVLARQKYERVVWTKDRTPPFTKEEVEELPGEGLNDPLRIGDGFCFYIQVPDKDFKRIATPRN